MNKSHKQEDKREKMKFAKICFRIIKRKKVKYGKCKAKRVLKAIDLRDAKQFQIDICENT